MKIGNSILNKQSNGVSPPKKQEQKMPQSRKKRIEDAEETIKHKLPSDEGDASGEDLANQSQEIAKEKHAFNARQDAEVDDIEKE